MISSIPSYLEKKITLNPIAEKYTSWVQNYPTIDKIAKLFNHLIRASCMWAMMSVMPYSLLTSSVICLSAALFYRITTENPCPFKYSLPSFFGGLAFQLAHQSPIPVIAWTAAVIWIVHQDVERVLKANKYNIKLSSCCKI